MDFSKLRVLVIGDIILDKYIRGRVDRVSPEAPIPIFDIDTEHPVKYILGGASNVARNVRSLGASCWIAGRIGADSEGEVVKSLLSEGGIYCDLLLKDPTYPTTVKTRYVTSSQQVLRVDHEDKKSIKGTKFSKLLLQDLYRHFRYFDAIIVSDYDKGFLFPRAIEHIALLKNKYNKIVVGDTHKTEVECFKYFTCLTPNKKELEGIYGQKFENADHATYYGNRLRRQLKMDQILVTLSEEGLYCSDGNEVGRFKALNPNVVDVTGCGDTVIAAYTLGLASGLNCCEAASVANKAAAVVVGKMGTAVASVEEMKNYG